MTGNDNHDEPMSLATDAEVRQAFDRLRIDGASVNPQEALARHRSLGRSADVVPDTRPVRQWLAAAAIAAVALIGGFALLSRGGTSTSVTAGSVDGSVDGTAPAGDPGLVTERVPVEDAPAVAATAVPATAVPAADSLEAIIGDESLLLTHGMIEDGKVFYALADGSPGIVLLGASGAQVFGESGCNDYQATWTGDGFTQIGRTKRCSHVMGTENQFLQALAKVDTAERTGDEVVLSGNGARLVFEPDVQFRLHVAQAGDTMESIAASYGVSVESLAAVNPGVDLEQELAAGAPVFLPILIVPEIADTTDYKGDPSVCGFPQWINDTRPLPPGQTAGTATQVASIDTTNIEVGCIQTVITLTDDDGGPASIGSGEVATEEVPYFGLEFRFLLEGRTFDTSNAYQLPRVGEPGVAAIVVQDGDVASVYVNHGAGDHMVVVLESAGQIMVVSQVEPAAAKPVVQPGVVVLPAPLSVEGPVSMPLTVSGYGQGFEGAQGLAVFDAEGNPVDADWIGGFNGAQRGSEYGIAVGNFTYAPFSFTIDGLGPGDYELRWRGVAGPPEGPEFRHIEAFTVAG